MMGQNLCDRYIKCDSKMNNDMCMGELNEIVGCVTTDECTVTAKDYLQCLYENNECKDGSYEMSKKCDDLEERVEDCCD